METQYTVQKKKKKRKNTYNKPYKRAWSFSNIECQSMTDLVTHPPGRGLLNYKITVFSYYVTEYEKQLHDNPLHIDPTVYELQHRVIYSNRLVITSQQ